MENKIFDIQFSVFKTLKEIFYEDEIDIFLTRKDKMPEKYIYIYKIEEELENYSECSKFTVLMEIVTGSSTSIVLSEIITKIRSKLNKELLEKELKQEITGFGISNLNVKRDINGNFESNIILSIFC